MSDFFPTFNSMQHRNSDIESLFEVLYDASISVKPDTFFGLNLQWPKFDLPTQYRQYIISFHTEYLDLEWTIKQAQIVYPKQLVLISEFDIAQHPAWPDNVVCLQQRTIHKQLNVAVMHHGYCNNPTVPQYKFSSLSFRADQYKIFVTAFLLKHVSKDNMILTFHNQKLGPIASWPNDIQALQGLDLNLSVQFINFNDQFDITKNRPVANACWQIPPFQNSLINLTNESVASSNSMLKSYSIILPGPYFTEKTFKPLLSARPFISVGQYKSLKELQALGFSTDFGIPNEYDNDPENFPRIGKIFSAIEYANSTDIKKLFDASFNSVIHNVNHIVNGDLSGRCRDLNSHHRKLLVTYLH